MISSSPYLFVYSSLRRGFRQSAYNYLIRYFNFVSDAKVRGVLSDFGDKPVGTPTEDDFFLIGELYQLNIENGSYVFGQLDDYEGLFPEDGQPPLYRREITTVYAEGGGTYEAWIYWYNGDVKGRPIIASGDVFEYVRSKMGRS
ncbi:MAG: gamma-glutamylcyclotransferase family protein [Ginsengibacter sp.]